MRADDRGFSAHGSAWISVAALTFTLLTCPAPWSVARAADEAATPAAPAPASGSEAGADEKAASPETAGAEPAPPHAPQGFGDARFGMSRAEVKAIFPGLVLVEDTEAKPREGAVQSEAPSMARYDLNDQEVLGSKGCTVGFQFAADYLYFIHLNCGKDESVRKRLEEKFGPAKEEVEGAVYWHLGPVTISLNPTSMRFAYIDRPYEQKVNRTLWTLMMQEGQQRRMNESTGGSQQTEPAEPAD